jgi:Icc-related predicted phosphoesterase
MRITFISDTHTKHTQITHDLPGGDILIHAGDFMNSGYHKNEAISFLDWFNTIPGYSHKIFIAGNHDRIFESLSDLSKEILEKYPRLDYLEDFSKYVYIQDHIPVKIYGSPWQPEFYNWAFNLPRNGEELKKVWENIPPDTDILITHGPGQGYLDTSGDPYNEPRLGCELLIERIKEIKPKIHVCGHIHGGYGYKFDGNTHFFNASVLNERYVYTNRPLTVDWDPEKNEIEFLT